jgi:hypothetical protein
VKKYIRDMIDDLKSGQKSKDFVPPVPPAATGGKTDDLDQPPPPPVPEDLNNQILSHNPLELECQLDYQAELSERLQTDS